MTIPYSKAYAGGFVDLPNTASPIDSAFLNAVEAALVALCAVAPTDKYLPVWKAASSRFEPALVAEGNLSLADVTTLNVSTSKHGFAPKLPNDATKYLDGTGAYSVPAFTGSGWTALGTTLTYSSTDGHTFVVTSGTDLSASLGIGDRIKVTDTGTQYFIITAISGTTITLYGGTAGALSGGAITNPFYSHLKVPFGFPLDPTKWTESATSTSDCAKASPVAGTWYGGSGLSPTGPSLAIPIGAWNVSWSADLEAVSGVIYLHGTLSTANSTESDTDFTARGETGGYDFTTGRGKPLVLTSKTTYYLNIKVTGGSPSSIALYGSTGTPSLIRAVCAYL